MKNTLKLAIIAGISVPFLSSAQVVVSGPETATTASLANSQFHNLVIAMTKDRKDLYTPEGLSLSIQPTIYFNYAPAAVGFTGGDWSAAATGPLSIEFVKRSNFSSFNVQPGADIDIGFIGEESTHDNELGFHEGGVYTKLFDYNASGDKPPMSYNLTSATSSNIRLQHRNLTEFTGNGFQINTERFRIYQARVNGEYVNEYLFAAADRDGTRDGDYDDGFFYVIGTGITPVPEPSQIAFFAFAGLLATVLIRRRIRRNRK